jgi:uncharacterized Fe-S cluster protein YjdI
MLSQLGDNVKEGFGHSGMCCRSDRGMFEVKECGWLTPGVCYVSPVLSYYMDYW